MYATPILFLLKMHCNRNAVVFFQLNCVKGFFTFNCNFGSGINSKPCFLCLKICMWKLCSLT